jgi:ATP-dependent RNA helicase DeaD
LFSATLPRGIVALAKQYQNAALRIDVSNAERAHADIEYRAVRVGASDVGHAVVNLLRLFDVAGALVFCNTREAVRRLQATLSERGFPAVALSGELSQGERNHAMLALRSGRARVCVATDVAARGIDLPGLDLVIHAELPHDAEVMQHRSGRTGRAGRKGVSVVLVTPAERRRAERLLASAHVQADWRGPPTVDEIKQLDVERLMRNPMLTEESGDDDRALAQSLLAAHSADAVATAFIRLYRAQLPAPEELTDPFEARDNPRRRDGEKRRDGGSRDDARKPREERRKPPREAAKFHDGPSNGVWFRIDVGRNKKADPKWILPEICRRGKVTKQDVGDIRIYEDETRFEVTEEAAPRFADAIRNAAHGAIQIEASTEPTHSPPPRHAPHAKKAKFHKKQRHGKKAE